MIYISSEYETHCLSFEGILQMQYENPRDLAIMR